MAEAVLLNQDEWLSKENLQDMAETLAICDSEMLAEVRKIWPAHALVAACRLLDADTKERIREMVVEQNSQSSVNAIAPNGGMELMRRSL